MSELSPLTFSVDVLFEGTRDFYELFRYFGFNHAVHGNDEQLKSQISENVLPKYLPIFNKVNWLGDCTDIYWRP